MSDDATVDITDVYPDAVRVQAREVRVGDYVFGPFGDRDRVIRATHNKRSIITPERFDPVVCSPEDYITIARASE